MPLFVMALHRSKNMGEQIDLFRAGINLVVWRIRLTGIGFRDG